MPLSILNSDNVLNVGTVANDNTGDNLRTAGQKINANFEDLDSAVAAIVTLPEATVANSTIRYDGVAYASTDGLKVDASGNTTVAGTLDVTGTTSVADLSVTGPATFSDSASFSTHVNLDDSAKLRLGDNSEFEIYHTAAGASVISETGGGNLEVRANQLNVLNADGTETMLTAQPDNAVTLYYDNNTKFATTDSGVSVVGNITVTGNVDGYDVSELGSKLAGIESGATADQSDLEIKEAYENNSDTNAFTDSDKTKLAGIEEGATASTGVPSGTKQLFVQTTAPTGWTKLTNHNDKALRVVSGTADSGGSDSFITVFGTGKTTANHTLSVAQMPSHTHPIINLGVPQPYIGNNVAGTQGSYSSRTAQFNSSAGSNQAHSHNLDNFDLQYVDVIIAEKD